MNQVILMGRLTRDPDIRYSNKGNDSLCIARWTLAVDRRFARKDDSNDQQSADFISCVAFGKTAEHAEKYYHQGIKIILSGRIQTGSYTNKDGQKVYTTEVVVNESEFAESKNADSSRNYQSSNNNAPSSQPDSEFINIPEGIEEDLPFK